MRPIHYFCGNAEIPEELQANQSRRVALYKSAAGLVRAYANIADELERAGYSAADTAKIKQDVDRCLKLREIVRKAAGESLDLKAYEADMRHLLDTYIQADEPKKISPFDDVPLLELIVKSGIADAIGSLPEGIRSSKDAIAETIANNVRSKIVKEHLNDPAYYDSMSRVLQEIIADLQAKRIGYAEYLKRIAVVAKQVQTGKTDDSPQELRTPGVRAIFNNLVASSDPEDSDRRLSLALAIDAKVREVRPDGWRGHQARENDIKRALLPLLQGNVQEVERLFAIIKNQGEY